MMIKNIFIVDDDSFYINILETKISFIGEFNIQKFHTGKDCLENSFKQPDLIFLDHILGDITGFEVLKEIKATYPNIHIITLSGQKEMKVAVKSLRFGATDYLVKGIDDTESNLTKIIEDCNRISKARQTIQKKRNKNILSFLF